jgi:hypothetical protein
MPGLAAKHVLGLPIEPKKLDASKNLASLGISC